METTTLNATDYSIDWTNVDLSQGYHRDQNIIEPLSFSTLLLEVHCNIQDINPDTVRKHFEKDLQSRIREAREIFNNNLDNIVKHAKNERSE